MQRVVSPNPVAAMLDNVLVSGRCAAKRSLTKPVAGLACSQKKRKLARCSVSSRSACEATLESAYERFGRREPAVSLYKPTPAPAALAALAIRAKASRRE